MTKPGQFTAMISATAFDLPIHREKVQEACLGEEVFPLWMKHLPTRDANGVKVSMEMVDKADIYIGVFAWRYGWVPEFDNPEEISITEMEFNRAVQRKAEGKLMEILIFVVHDDHPPARASDIEIGEEAQRKLKAFKDRASTGRVRGEFISPDDLRAKVTQALAAFLKKQAGSTAKAHTGSPPTDAPSTIPKPPAFYAEPDYIGSHKFVGRETELRDLSEWANKSDPTNLLLFEAIGGNGKSMLTWEWTIWHATKGRSGGDAWAGRFWYSFYERGTTMEGFCQRALAYMTGRPLEEFAKKKTSMLVTDLLAQLHARPWLLILDGLERVLVAYHRIDAAEVPDEEVNAPTDKILDRNPCDAIRDEDSNLLRAFAACAPSKILVSTRLTPRVLLNSAGQPIPGAKRITLPGLRPPDAEALLRQSGITGDSTAIQDYLRQNCDNHPLVIGVLAGLINSPGPHRGKFDDWAADQAYGAKLNLASLNLIQSRNGILRAAMDALEPASRQLLSTLALLSSAVDYETVAAFNPHVPPDAKKLGGTIADLEQRGLLQYNPHEHRYDLHPVVRGVAAGSMKDEDKTRHGQRVVDHFASQPHSPYREARTMADVESGLHVVRTLLKLGHYQEAADAYRGDLSQALKFNLEAHVEVLALLRPFFPAGWDQLSKVVRASDATYLANEAALGLNRCGERGNALGALGAVIRRHLASEHLRNARTILSNITRNLSAQNQLANALRVDALALDLATVTEDAKAIFISRLFLFADQSRLGRWPEAQATWRQLDPMGRKWSRAVYRQGSVERHFARFHFWQGSLQEEHLTAATNLAEKDSNRSTLRNLHWLRGAWRLEQGEWALAAASFDTAVTMAREVRLVDAESETGLALAKYHLGQLTGDAARSEAERLAGLRDPAHRTLALFWQAIGDPDQAKHHALAAYRWAWADGEPYVNRYELMKATELLNSLGVPIPNLPPYDPAKHEPFPWEADVRAAIEKLKAKKV